MFCVMNLEKIQVLHFEFYCGKNLPQYSNCNDAPVYLNIEERSSLGLGLSSFRYC